MKKILLPLVLLIAALFLTINAGAIERTLPAGATGHTEIIDVDDSEAIVIPAIWNQSTISISQAHNETGTFRIAIGTSTVDPDLPLIESVAISFGSSGFVAVQSGSGTVKLAVYHVKE
jgi:hypothetical protein